jgi:RimJ/RimL family protein N-acetyltransferase
VALELRETAERDLPGVLAIEADPEVAPWITRWPLQRHRRAIIEPDEAHLALYDDGSLVGFVLLAGLCAESGLIELRRIALGRRGAGIGALALSIVLDHSFGALGANRVWLDVLPGNLRALRVYERAGFADERLLDAAHLLPGGSSVAPRVMSIRRPIPTAPTG